MIKHISIASLLFLSSNTVLATKWYCKRTSDNQMRPIRSIDCSEQMGGTAYCDQKSEIVNCGTYKVDKGQIKVSFLRKGKNGKTVQKTRNLGKASIRPETVEPTPASAPSGGSSETTSNNGGGFWGKLLGGSKKSSKGSRGIFANRYPPRIADFSRSKAEAERFANAEWNALTVTQKAQYIREVAAAVDQAHGFGFDPDVVTCKTYRESEFRPQVKASDKRSQAIGLSQITKGTSIDQFKRGTWFRSKIPGFEGITDGMVFRAQMAHSMPAQIELGMAVMQQKAIDTGSKKMFNILHNYYGTKSDSANNSYARHLINCAKCAKKSGLTRYCLEKSR